MFDEFGINAGLVEELHTQWLQSPQSVGEEWQRFFEGTTGTEGPLAVPVMAPPAAGGTNGSTAKAKTNGNGATISVRPPPAPAAYRDAVRESVIAATELQNRVAQLVNAYRVR